jgi:hypothetical protein
VSNVQSLTGKEFAALSLEAAGRREGMSGLWRCARTKLLSIAARVSGLGSLASDEYVPKVQNLMRRKDRHKSDSMEVACDLIQLPWILRKALLVLNSLEVRPQSAVTFV